MAKKSIIMVEDKFLVNIIKNGPNGASITTVSENINDATKYSTDMASDIFMTLRSEGKKVNIKTV